MSRAAYALRVIVEQPSPGAKAILPDLLTALQAPHAEVQSEVAQVLGAMGRDARDAIPLLLDGLRIPPSFRIGEDSFMSPEKEFIEAIGRIGTEDTDAVAVLSSILKDGSREHLHRVTAATLGKLGAAAQSTVPLLVTKLRNDGDEYEQRETAYALAMIRPAGVTSLLDVFQSDSERKTLRLQACTALDAAIKLDSRIIPALRMALETADPDIRMCAANRLARVGETTEIVQAVLAAAFVKSDRWEATDSLKALGSSSLSTVFKLLKTPDIESWSEKWPV